MMERRTNRLGWVGLAILFLSVVLVRSESIQETLSIQTAEVNDEASADLASRLSVSSFGPEGGARRDLKKTQAPNTVCFPTATTNKKSCNAKKSGCADAGHPIKWVGKGCPHPKGTPGDGGCQVSFQEV